MNIIFDDDLVEKVAIAICEAEGLEDDWERPVMFMSDANSTWEGCREIYRNMARAALARVQS